ncbi:hypothetical protein N7532_009653 [Penicillium argentinense]|uniref:Uncharacterized protein n=1 Tax=Penicillium argentinense TaxID=1131581 RepID=A0A9W9EZX5_9EURO|nr:uncharacterized protein N7532_009653 [Penicillium argentinense]KAJ5090969.1 hypothetical protein N7532_009653 [Penicillium argentinense]
MIARRGVSLLKAMLGAEQQGSWRKHPATESCEAQVRLNGGGLDIATIIQTFYRQDQESYSNQSPSRLDRSSTTKPSNHEHWPSVMHQGPISIPTDELLVPFGVEYAEGLDDILSLATNYLN